MAQFRNIDLENIQKDHKYVKRLELSVDNLNQKLTKLKTQLQKLKNENASLKASNDNHIYINEKLNKALQKRLADKQKERSKKDAKDKKKNTDKMDPYMLNTSSKQDMKLDIPGSSKSTTVQNSNDKVGNSSS